MTSTEALDEIRRLATQDRVILTYLMPNNVVDREVLLDGTLFMPWFIQKSADMGKLKSGGKSGGRIWMETDLMRLW